MGGASPLTILSFPPGLFADFPCGGGETGCRKGLHRFNWTLLGAPLLAHRVRVPAYVPIALELLQRAPFTRPQTATCAPMRPRREDAPSGHCLQRGWQWCDVPFTPAPLIARPKPKPRGSPAKKSPKHG